MHGQNTVLYYRVAYKTDPKSLFELYGFHHYIIVNTLLLLIDHQLIFDPGLEKVNDLVISYGTYVYMQRLGELR